MRNVLIVTNHFAQNSHFRSTRISGLVKYLPRFGWDPIVLTANAPVESQEDPNIYEVPYEDSATLLKRRLGLIPNTSMKEQLNEGSNVKKAASRLAVAAWSETFDFPDHSRNWINPAVNAGLKLIPQFNFDVILSSFGPSSSHIVARKLKKASGIPWVADFRDLWTQNSYFYGSPVKRLRTRRLEIKTLEDANAITTVSDPLRDRLSEIYKGTNITTITNGFDTDEMAPKDTVLDDKFTISYTGKIYEGGRDPAPFFEAIRQLVASSELDPKMFSVNIYGEDASWLTNKIAESNVQGIVNQHGYISRKEATKVQRRSQLLLLLNWNDPKEQGIFTGKVFDYLAAQRPIIAVGPRQEVVSALLANTGAGYDASTVAEIREAIKRLYDEFSTNGSVEYHGDQSKIHLYSHEEMARKFATVLDSL